MLGLALRFSSYTSILGDVCLWVGVPSASSALMVPLPESFHECATSLDRGRHCSGFERVCTTGGACFAPPPLSSDCGTNKTVKAILLPGRSGKSPRFLSGSLFARKRSWYQRGSVARCVTPPHRTAGSGQCARGGALVGRRMGGWGEG